MAISQTFCFAYELDYHISWEFSLSLSVPKLTNDYKKLIFYGAGVNWYYWIIRLDVSQLINPSWRELLFDKLSYMA